MSNSTEPADGLHSRTNCFMGSVGLVVSGLVVSLAFTVTVSAPDAYSHPSPSLSSPSVARTVATAPALDRTPPRPVSKLTLNSRGTTTVSLRWANPTGRDLNRVVVRRAVGERAPRTIRSGASVKVSAAKASGVTDRGLRAATTYTYAVFTRDRAGNVSPRPAVLRVRTLALPDKTPPPSPRTAAARSRPGGIQVSWSRVSAKDLRGYRVLIATGPKGPWSAILQTPAGVTNGWARGLATDLTYWFAVQSVDTAGNLSSRSAPVSARTTELNPATAADPSGYWLALDRSIDTARTHPPTDLVFIGDSLIENLTYFHADGKPYWDRLYANRAVNLGVGGDSTQNVLWRLQQQSIAGLSPRVIVLLAGTNNLYPPPWYQASSVEQTLEGLRAVVAKLRAQAPSARILLCELIPRGRAKTDPLRIAVNAVNRRLREGAVPNVTLVPNDGYLARDGSLSPTVSYDSLHLTGDGYGIFIRNLESRLSAAL